MTLHNNLPLELVREISEYIDTVYWCKRAKKFITRFSKQDARYNILKNGVKKVNVYSPYFVYVYYGNNRRLEKIIIDDIAYRYSENSNRHMYVLGKDKISFVCSTRPSHEKIILHNHYYYNNRQQMINLLVKLDNLI